MIEPEEHLLRFVQLHVGLQRIAKCLVEFRWMKAVQGQQPNVMEHAGNVQFLSFEWLLQLAQNS